MWLKALLALVAKAGRHKDSKPKEPAIWVRESSSNVDLISALSCEASQREVKGDPMLAKRSARTESAGPTGKQPQERASAPAIRKLSYREE